ncbi:MAG: ribonuclease P protein component [Bacteroides sp.]|nr:ribonuclease P protein component [Eubacterium sp.]MCM1418496.1 ribonuclease P protein component [Roseburia sp.]MCM1462515.1 ribonuclease P protein component [Bacteroides sp.]
MGELSKGYLTIKKDREFRYLFAKGRTVVTYAFVCYFKESRRRRNRLGLVSGKKIGNAVVRNRARRVLREAFRVFDHDLRQSTEKRYDFIFVARGATAAQKSQKLLKLMETKLIPALGSTPTAPKDQGRPAR